jgi:cob(I)alamin adenosyltransferase
VSIKFYTQVARTTFNAEHVEKLERWIDEMDDELPTLTAFILPVRTT